MENKEKIKEFLKIIENIGHYEDLYRDALYYDQEMGKLINVNSEKTYVLSEKELKLLNTLKYITVEELNKVVNSLRIYQSKSIKLWFGDNNDKKQKK